DGRRPPGLQPLRDGSLEFVRDPDIAAARCPGADARAGGGDREREPEDGAAEQPPRPAVPARLLRRDVAGLAHADLSVVVPNHEAGIVELAQMLRAELRGRDGRVPA